MTDGIREVTCDGCSSHNVGSTIHQAMFDLKHEAGCSPSYSPSYTAHEIKAYSGAETSWKIDQRGNQIA